MLLGAKLRRLREGAGIGRADAGWAIRASESKISRMELGRVALKERDVADLLTLYEVDGEERDALLSRARQANIPGWWQRYSELLPTWFQSYVELESAAALIRSYETKFVPGLLQTREYARAVVGTGHAVVHGDDVERRVDVRMRRQHLLGRDDAPALWAVLDEAVLRRPIGGTDVMRAQIRFLLEMAKLPRVTLQVLPFSVGGHVLAVDPFTILRFAEPDLPDVVYAELLTGALYLDGRGDVEQYGAAMDDLHRQAEPPHRTAEILQDLGSQL